MREVFRNEFSWSVTRDRLFEECARKYYFNYYGYWGGWEPDAPERVREIYVLKQLAHRATWIGQVVHDCIKRSLDNCARDIPVLPLDEILTITRDRMRRDFRSSRSGHYRSNPKHACGLFEHEYGIDVPDEQWRAAWEQVERCLKTFYRSETYAELSALAAEDFLEIERLSTFDLDGNPVSIRLDCVTREKDRVIVWDWKSGRRESRDAKFQLACYAFYAHAAYGIPIHRIALRRFELYHDALHEDTIGERELTEVLSYIRGSISDMKATLDDPDRNLASEGCFAKASRREVCYRCEFLKVCGPDLPARIDPSAGDKV
jgi:hypothetical protein